MRPSARFGASGTVLRGRGSNAGPAYRRGIATRRPSPTPGLAQLRHQSNASVEPVGPSLPTVPPKVVESGLAGTSTPLSLDAFETGPKAAGNPLLATAPLNGIGDAGKASGPPTTNRLRQLLESSGHAAANSSSKGTRRPNSTSSGPTEHDAAAKDKIASSSGGNSNRLKQLLVAANEAASPKTPEVDGQASSGSAMSGTEKKIPKSEPLESGKAVGQSGQGSESAASAQSSGQPAPSGRNRLRQMLMSAPNKADLPSAAVRQGPTSGSGSANQTSESASAGQASQNQPGTNKTQSTPVVSHRLRHLISSAGSKASSAGTADRGPTAAESPKLPPAAPTENRLRQLLMATRAPVPLDKPLGSMEPAAPPSPSPLNFNPSKSAQNSVPKGATGLSEPLLAAMRKHAEALAARTSALAQSQQQSKVEDSNKAKVATSSSLSRRLGARRDGTTELKDEQRPPESESKPNVHLQSSERRGDIKDSAKEKIRDRSRLRPGDETQSRIQLSDAHYRTKHLRSTSPRPEKEAGLHSPVSLRSAKDRWAKPESKPIGLMDRRRSVLKRDEVKGATAGEVPDESEVLEVQEKPAERRFTKTAPAKEEKEPERRGKDWRHGRKQLVEEEEEEEVELQRGRPKKEKAGRVDASLGARQKKREESSVYGTIGRTPKVKAKRDIVLPISVSVAGLADLVGLPIGKIQRKMRDMGLDETQTYPDHRLGPDMSSLVVLECGHNPVVSTDAPTVTPDDAARMSQVTDLAPRPAPKSWDLYPERSPVVAIMGHVDHGKTTLLDSLRRTAVAASEAGGITQHIGAFIYQPPVGRKITFLDTPGHAAFEAMRARGAQATDIVVLVVAADDGPMPQTAESIRLARNAGATLVVAVTKCDRPGADPYKVQEKLLEHGIQTEEFGGDIPAVEVSAIKGEGLDQLVETIQTIAEVELDLRGDPDGPVEGTVLESRVDKGRGAVATVLVRRGTLVSGRVIVAGDTYCKVRRMDGADGNDLAEAGPAVPVEISGWKEQPSAGEFVLEAPDEATARRVVDSRKLRADVAEEVKSLDALNELRARHRDRRKEGLSTDQALIEQQKRETEDEKNKSRTFAIIVKADVDGSLEAILQQLAKLPQDEVTVYVVDGGVGPVTESDLMKAEVADAMIVSFNLPVDKKLLEQAQSRKIDVREHNVIYRMLDEVKELMSERLPPLIVVDVVAEAAIQAVFEITVKKGGKEKAAGCKMESGKLTRKTRVRVLRRNETIHEGTLRSLKHFKKEVDELVKGQECGLMIDGFEDFEPGDVIQGITITEVARKIA